MLVHQFDQPEPPADWVGEGSPLDQATGLGVAARRSWSPAQVVDEIERARRQPSDLLTQPDLDWQEPRLTPVGPAPRHVAVEMRVNDVYLHLCDIRTAIGQTDRWAGRRHRKPGKESCDRPGGAAVAVGLGQKGRRPRGPTPATVAERRSAASIKTSSMREGKAVVEPQDGTPMPSSTGTAWHISWPSAVATRWCRREAGLVATGEPARALLEKFRLVVIDWSTGCAPPSLASQGRSRIISTRLLTSWARSRGTIRTASSVATTTNPSTPIAATSGPSDLR